MLIKHHFFEFQKKDSSKPYRKKSIHWNQNMAKRVGKCKTQNQPEFVF